MIIVGEQSAIWKAVDAAMRSALTDRKIQAAVNFYLSDICSTDTIREQIIADVRNELIAPVTPEQRILIQ